MTTAMVVGLMFLASSVFASMAVFASEYKHSTWIMGSLLVIDVLLIFIVGNMTLVIHAAPVV